MSLLTQLEQSLRAKGQNVTQSRQQVFQALQGQEPMEMASLIRRCPNIDRASVYRTVTLFEQLGIVTRLHTGWKYKLELSGAFHEHHHHANCLHCGNSLVLAESVRLEKQLQQIADKLSFKIERHQIEIQGYCKSCR